MLMETHSSQLSELVEVGGLELGALDVVALVDLLVLGVRAVVARAHREQDHVLAGRLLEAQGHRDRAAWKETLGMLQFYDFFVKSK